MKLITKRQKPIKTTLMKSPTISTTGPISLSKMASILTIYRKIVSNLKIRQEILSTMRPRQQECSNYTIGPTILWTEDPNDVGLFTTDEDYTHFIGFEPPFQNPLSKRYLGKIIRSKSMRMTKGTILIKQSTKQSTPPDAFHIPVHFCAYRIDHSGVFTIFDPSWNATDPGIYSTATFYDTLKAFDIPYIHAFPDTPHHWQSRLPDDVFCQTWTLKWLHNDSARFPLPITRRDASKQIAGYIREFVRIVHRDISIYTPLFPTYKLEGNTLDIVCRMIWSQSFLEKTIHDLF